MKRVLCLLLVGMLLVTGCKNDNVTPNPNNGDDSHFAAADVKPYTEFPSALSATKIGTISRSVSPAAGGLYYREEANRYGVMSFDGSYDSGPVYTVCKPLGKYFLVSMVNPEETDPMKFNQSGVVDATGKVIVPLSYASVDAVMAPGNTSTMDPVAASTVRFVRASEIVGLASSEAEGLTHAENSDGTKTYYKGNWYLYDLYTGQKIPGATGTKRYASYSYGDRYVKYVTDDKQQVVATPDGKMLPAEAIHLNNGYYRIESERAVYRGDMTKLFTYAADGYVPCQTTAITKYILASKTVEDRVVYVLLDETGTAVTAEMDGIPTVYGDLLYVNERVYNFKGEQPVEGIYSSVYMDYETRQCWMLTDKNTKEKIVINKDGKVLYRGNDELVKLNINYFTLNRTENEVQSLLNLKDGTFSLQGAMMAPWLVKVADEGGTTYSLVDAISGNAILSGYNDVFVAYNGSDIVYVYAETTDGQIEAYYVR